MSGSGRTPGRAAYEAWHAKLAERHPIATGPKPWDELAAEVRGEWEAAAQAAIAAAPALRTPEQVGTIAGTMAVYERDRAAPELAAAMAETRQLRELLAEILATFGPPARPGAVRWTAKQVAGWRQRAGIIAEPAPDRQGDETARPARELREAMAETRRVAETVRPVLDCFRKASDGWRGRVSAVVLARAYAATGTVPDCLRHVEGQ